MALRFTHAESWLLTTKFNMLSGDEHPMCAAVEVWLSLPYVTLLNMHGPSRSY